MDFSHIELRKKGANGICHVSNEGQMIWKELRNNPCYQKALGGHDNDISPEVNHATSLQHTRTIRGSCSSHLAAGLCDGCVATYILT